MVSNQPQGAPTWSMATLFPGSRADAPKLKTDCNFMKFVFTEQEWKRDVVDAGDGVLCIVDVFNPLWGPCEVHSRCTSHLHHICL